ncbi:MAG: DUF6132 family protein [Victivallales bacterium]|nr:DUF6132 family protein [Victivallales bacterium]
MIIKAVIGVVAGAAIGGFLGYLGQCTGSS